jgi:glycine cleavage system aminomethyltransferase T
LSTPLPNPLIELHKRLPTVETQPYDMAEIVSTFGNAGREYAAMYESCGLMDVPQRAVLELTGKDRNVFLNNLVSNVTWDKSTKQPMPTGTGVYAYFLNLRGRIVADMNVLELGDRHARRDRRAEGRTAAFGVGQVPVRREGRDVEQTRRAARVVAARSQGRRRIAAGDRLAGRARRAAVGRERDDSWHRLRHL